MLTPAEMLRERDANVTPADLVDVEDAVARLTSRAGVVPVPPLSTLGQGMEDPKALDDDEFKWCVKGQHRVPRHRFTKCATNRDGLYSYCKDCYNEYRNKWEADVREGKRQRPDGKRYHFPVDANPSS